MAGGEVAKQLNVEIPADLHRRFKAYVALQETTMQSEICRLISEVCKS